MTAKKNTNTSPVTAPIPDSNHNGVLDGQDILTQLAKEERLGAKRTPGERAHGVFEEVGVRDITTTFTLNSLAGMKLRPNAFGMVADAVKGDLNDIMRQASNDLVKDPNARATMTAGITKKCQKLHLSAEETALNVADAVSMYDFAQTFAKTFPKGIKLEAKDMPAIMQHFGTLVVPIYRTPTPPAEKTRAPSPSIA